MREIFRKQVVNSRSDEFNPPPGAQSTFVCWNYFPTGKETPINQQQLSL